MKCIICAKKIIEGFTWEDETSFACSEKCMLKSGLSQSDLNADINLGTVYWATKKEIETKNK